VGVVQVTVNDLFGEGEGAVQPKKEKAPSARSGFLPNGTENGETVTSTKEWVATVMLQTTNMRVEVQPASDDIAARFSLSAQRKEGDPVSRYGAVEPASYHSP
jgi:hypothetical protein